MLSRGGHGGDPLQKLARHHNALVTERERSGARNGVGKVVVPAGRVVDAVPTAARRSALQPAELGDKARMVEQLDALLFNNGKRSTYRSLFGFALCSQRMPHAAKLSTTHEPAYSSDCTLPML